jgi:hypothetical protein
MVVSPLSLAFMRNRPLRCFTSQFTRLLLRTFGWQQALSMSSELEPFACRFIVITHYEPKTPFHHCIVMVIATSAGKLSPPIQVQSWFLNRKLDLWILWRSSSHQENVTLKSGQSTNSATFLEVKFRSLVQEIYFSLFKPIGWKSISLVLPIHRRR